MVSGHADSPHPSNLGLQILSTLASVTVGALFFALWLRQDPFLALACSHPFGSRLRRGTSLYMGFRLDRPRHTCSLRPAAKTGGRGLLPLCPQSHVCRLLRRLDRPVGHLRPRQQKLPCRRRRRDPSCCPLCSSLRRTCSPARVRGRLRPLLPQRSPLAAPLSSLASIVRRPCTPKEWQNDRLGSPAA